MQDFEEVALGLRVQAAKKAALTVNEHLKITDAEAAMVSHLPNSPEYNLILRIMEGECEKLETAHMSAWKDEKVFQRTGLIAVSARVFFEQFQREINYHSGEYRSVLETINVQKEVAAMTPEEFIRKGFGMDSE